MAEDAKNSLDAIWQEAEDLFRSLTDQTLRLDPPRTLADVCKQLDAQQQLPTSTSNDRRRDAKQAGLNVLYCLKNLGAIAAQGASMV